MNEIKHIKEAKCKLRQSFPVLLSVVMFVLISLP